MKQESRSSSNSTSNTKENNQQTRTQDKRGHQGIRLKTRTKMIMYLRLFVFFAVPTTMLYHVCMVFTSANIPSGRPDPAGSITTTTTGVSSSAGDDRDVQKQPSASSTTTAIQTASVFKEKTEEHHHFVDVTHPIVSYFAAGTSTRKEAEGKESEMFGLIEDIEDDDTKRTDEDLISMKFSPFSSRIPCSEPRSSYRSDFARGTEGRVHLLGLGLNATLFKNDVLSQLLQLNCEYQANIHVSTRHGGRELAERFASAQEKCYGKQVAKSQCGTADFGQDPPSARTITNRVERIAFLRDHLRAKLKGFRESSFEDQTGFHREKVTGEAVVMADLDLYSMPSNAEILLEAHRIIHGKEYDVICAAGLMHHPFGYYDIFATVLEDSTFLYPLSGRLHPFPREDETLSLIRSDPLFGNFTQAHIFEFLEKTGDHNRDGIVPVRSCFGGLAIYRMSTFLEESCSYTATVDEKYQSFANIDDGRPCEHVIFHDCLRESQPPANIAIQSNLKTWWDQPFSMGGFLSPGGKISEGLVGRDGLVRYANRPDQTLSLRNEHFRFQIDDEGSLVIEDLSPNNKTPIIIWRLPPHALQKSPKIKEVEYAFLTLEDSGSIVLTHQFRKGPDEDCPLPTLVTTAGACRLVVWRSTRSRWQIETIGEDDGRASWPVLHLGKDGVLRVIDVLQERVVWQTKDAPVNVEDIIKNEIKNEVDISCIPSGTEKEINDALSGPFSRAMLCPGSVFLLKDSIRMTSPHQAVYTEGFPLGEQRAVLRLADPSVVVAISMLDSDHAQVKSVVIDGNRPTLSHAEGDDYLKPLIQAGGRSVGQVFSDTHAMNTRSWTLLHFIEGDETKSCRGALVEGNTFGPAGHHQGGLWADGVSFACQQSIVRQNTIVDATDVALVLFGAMGTVIEDNYILARERTASAGITLVDFDPYEGNFSGSVVRNNIIEALHNGTIGVGIAMGHRTWQCGATEENGKARRRLFNGTVINNIVRGKGLQYGFVIDGVENWTADGNVDEADRSTVGAPYSVSSNCRPPLPGFADFLVNLETSHGTFQEQFQNANLEFIIGSIIQLHDPVDDCIPSGDQHSINSKLSGPFSKAVLCQGAVFNLTGPVEYTDKHQTVFTQGKPSDDSRAILSIVDPSLAVAVRMEESFASLTNVIIDGNRPLLGSVERSQYTKNALIQAGNGGSGQIIQGIHALNTRSWATLHLAEGDPAARCDGALVEDSVFGPSGDPASLDRLAVGIALACRGSQVRRNVIMDATDVGLSLFGAPGSLVEKNLVLCETRSLRVGISLVDYEPFEGNFSNTVVRENVILELSPNFSIALGIAMGSRDWESVHIGSSVRSQPRTLYGATVVDNVIDGVLPIVDSSALENWTSSNNRNLGAADDWSIGTSIRARSIDNTKSLAAALNYEGANEKDNLLNFSRVFSKIPSGFPCYPPDGQSAKRGFFYVKIPRTASTTIAGVARRIAKRYPFRQATNPGSNTTNAEAINESTSSSRRNWTCNFKVGHGSPRKKFDYGSRDRKRSFLWTFVRNPGDRVLSSFFYHAVSKTGLAEGVDVDEKFLEWAKNTTVGGVPLANYQVEFLRLREDLNTTQDDEEIVPHIVEAYDFIGVTERMEESLVVLMMLLDLEIADILHISSKRQAYAFTSDSQGNLKCVKMVPKRTTPVMHSFLASDEWEINNYQDLLLHRAASESLDLTIEALEKDGFSKHLRSFRRALALAKLRCEDEAIFPCTADGPPNNDHNCYGRDEGCGHECLDRVWETLSTKDTFRQRERIHVSQHEPASKQALGLVWLMTFPNSGTSYTLQLAASLSGIAAATNYGVETEGEMDSIYNGTDVGPYWIRSPASRPDRGLILTKTHCGGRCFFPCSHYEFLVTQQESFDECRRYTKAVDNGEKEFYYEATSVRKIVHVFRDPFDNVVARFHLARKISYHKFELADYQDDPEGFVAFCRDHVDIWTDVDGFVPPIEEDLWDILKTVPCHTDFLRYIQWHNHAHEVAIELDVPVLVIHYKDYASDWNRTVTRLVDFMEQSVEMPGGKAAVFKAGKTYSHYYLDHQRAAVESVFRKLSSDFTWDQTSQYFIGGIEQKNTGQQHSVVDFGIHQPSHGRQLVWLMTFPNSGTSYTLELVASLSGIATATNYGTETKGELASVQIGADGGPYWVPGQSSRPDRGLILTKTHCGGRCFRCPYDKSVVTQQEFFDECGRYTKAVDNGKKEFFYDATSVRKIVHVFRDPFDNVVARFHLGRRNKEENPELVGYQDDPEGFVAFCRDHVDSWTKVDGFVPPIEEDLWDILKTVPCHTDFLRYIQWHNHAHEVAIELDVPVLVIHYEDYASDWNRTVTRLVDFMEQSVEMPGGKAAVFKAGKTYSHYYLDHQRAAMESVFRKLSSNFTWNRVARYLEVPDSASKKTDIGVFGDENQEGTASTCSFDMLLPAFGSFGCSGEEDINQRLILEVPANAILEHSERSSLQYQGRGSSRVATIKLSPETSCKALISVDFCHDVNVADVDCLDEGSTISADLGSTVSTFLFISAFQQNITLEGLLPLWGNVMKEDSTNSKKKRIVGYIYPTLEAGYEYRPLNDIIAQRALGAYLKPMPMEIAQFWLPLAESLEFAEHNNFDLPNIMTPKGFGVLSNGTQHAVVLTDAEILSKQDAVGEGGEVLLQANMLKHRNCEKFISFLLMVDNHMLLDNLRKEERVLSKRFESELRQMKYREGECTLRSVVLYLRSLLIRRSDDVTEEHSLSELSSTNPRPCTYDTLRDAFGGVNKSLTNHDHEPGGCWSLQEEIVHIPSENILDSDRLPILGLGSEGVVHKAVISLPGTERACSVAVKTDMCHFQGRIVSCLHSGAAKVRYGHSIVDQEYIGALLFFAARKSGIDLSGWLPIWGAVTDEPFQTAGKVPRMKTLVMPLREFQTFEDVFTTRSEVLPSKSHRIAGAKQMAEILLPVLDTLLFAERLGLSFQDIHAKNIGLMTSSSDQRAFIFDSTHLRFLEGDQCSVPGRACEFCPEYHFYKDKRFPGFTSEMTRYKDCRNFLRLILLIFRSNANNVEKDPLEVKLVLILHSYGKCSLSNVKATLLDYLSDKTSRLPFLIGGKKFELSPFNESKALSPIEEADLTDNIDARDQNLTKTLNEDVMKAALLDLMSNHNITLCHTRNRASSIGDSSRIRWTTEPTEVIAGTGLLAGQSLYAESLQGPITLLLDTCAIDPTSRRYFTIVQAKDGCSRSGCAFDIVGSRGILDAPLNCGFNTSDPHYSCPCDLEEPALWYDKPMKRWRILMHQRRTKSVKATCIPSTDGHEFCGGYAETFGTSVAGPWKYSYFEAAYGNEVRFNQHDGSRLFKYEKLLQRRRPTVILSESGSLDGGFILNEVCESVVSKSQGHNGSDVAVCGERMFEVSRSSASHRQKPSGKIYLVYHAETTNKTYPDALGPRGKTRARRLISQFDNGVNEAPRTIIAPLVEDKTRRGQRLRDTVTPLAKHLGINLTIGPTLVHSPRWTPEGDAKVAAMALEALHDGPVLIAYWSFVQGLCAELGTKCDEFEDNGKYHILHVTDGYVVKVENGLHDQFGDDLAWEDLNSTMRARWEALGFNDEVWEMDGSVNFPATWGGMSEEQRVAASSLGYNQSTWDADCTFYQLFVPEEFVHCQIDNMDSYTSIAWKSLLPKVVWSIFTAALTVELFLLCIRSMNSYYSR